MTSVNHSPLHSGCHGSSLWGCWVKSIWGLYRVSLAEDNRASTL